MIMCGAKTPLRRCRREPLFAELEILPRVFATVVLETAILDAEEPRQRLPSEQAG